MKCEIFGCRYNIHHTTKNHECGKCHKKGHGRRECSLNNNGVELRIQKISDENYNKLKKGEKTGTLDDLLYSSITGGEYITKELGMGWMAYTRNNRGVIEYVILDEVAHNIYSKVNNPQSFVMLKCFMHGYKEHIYHLAARWKPTKIVYQNDNLLA